MKCTSLSVMGAVLFLSFATNASAYEEIDAPAVMTKTKFEVKNGDRITITAGGKWKMGPFIGSCGPTGFAGGKYDDYNLTSIANHGALIGKIGDSIWYNIGVSRTIIADRDGVLILGPNDNEQENNGGSLRVTIKINGQ